MIQLRTILRPADNSGARRLMVIGISAKIGKIASLGQVVNCVVDGADPNGAVTDSEKVRSDGTYVKFDDNAGVVIDKQGFPKGTRILGPIAREVKESGYTKIASLAREVV